MHSRNYKFLALMRMEVLPLQQGEDVIQMYW